MKNIKKFDNFINESFSKNKDAIVITVHEIRDYNKLKQDLNRWGIEMDVESFMDDPDEILNQMIYYPIDVVIYLHDTKKYQVYTKDPFEVNDEVDWDAFNLYSEIDDFYNDDKAIEFLKNVNVTLPNYNPRQRPIRTIK